MTRKEQKKEQARQWAKEGLLRIDQVQRIIMKSYSAVRYLLSMGTLEYYKDGPSGSRFRVWISLKSVIDYIDKWEE